MATAKGGHCGHMEDIPHAALRGPGGALHVGHSPYLLGQHSALEGWSACGKLWDLLAAQQGAGRLRAWGCGVWSRDQVRGQGKGGAK